MKMKSDRRDVLRVVLLLALAAGAGGAGSANDAASASATDAGDEAIWQDPQFEREFMGSFGVNSDIEPSVSSLEYETMQEVLPLLGTDSAAAIEILQRALKKDESASAVFDFTLGNIHFQEDRLDEAAVNYRNALAKFPSFRRAHQNLGLVHVRQGECSEAVGSLSRVIELGGNEALTYGLLGRCYAELEQYVAAESAYRRAMMLQPRRLPWKLGLTEAVLRQGKYPEALALSQQLLDEDPDAADYWMIQANAFVGAGRPLDAAGNFEIVRRMGKATRQSLYTLGDIYVNHSLWDMAASAYVEAYRLDPEQELHRPMRCIEILAQRDALEQAKMLLEAAESTFGERLDDNQRKKLLKFEARIAVAEGEGGQAVDVLEEIVALDPLDGEALMLLGQHYARSGDAERAIFYYERAMSIDEFEADAGVRKAQLLVGEERYAEAVPLLKRAQEIEPRDNVLRYLEQVERIARSSN